MCGFPFIISIGVLFDNAADMLHYRYCVCTFNKTAYCQTLTLVTYGRCGAHKEWVVA